MNNAEKFQEVFGYYATEMWAKPEAEFLDWINEDYNTLATPKPVCEDAISKRKLMTDLQGIWDAYTPNNMTDFQDVLEDIYYKIKNAPSVTPTERTGKWEHHIDRNGIPWERCSECGDSTLSVDRENINYCPNCGAKMEE